MGYYTKIDDLPTIKKDKIKEAKEILTKTKVIIDYYEDLEIDELGNVMFSDYNRKMYDIDEFAQALAPFTDESRMSCTGEEGEMWSIAFDGKGLWKEQKAVISWVDYK